MPRLYGDDLEQILKKFETLFPYLKLISSENKINDPFDPRVVDAYWIGNDFLKNVKKPRLYEHLTDNLLLKKKLPSTEIEKLTYKFSSNVNAHHSFHVFNIWKRTGYVENPHTLLTMDECRIGWGQVIDVQNKIIKVLYEPLIFNNRKLDFGKPILKDILYEISGGIKKNDWISFHWSSFCSVLSLNELERLKYWTRVNMHISNKK